MTLDGLAAAPTQSDLPDFDVEVDGVLVRRG